MKVNVVLKSYYENGVDYTTIERIFVNWQDAVDYVESQSNPNSFLIEEHEVLDDLVL